jgi:hypothetical protein
MTANRKQRDKSLKKEKTKEKQNVWIREILFRSLNDGWDVHESEIKKRSIVFIVPGLKELYVVKFQTFCNPTPRIWVRGLWRSQGPQYFLLCEQVSGLVGNAGE